MQQSGARGRSLLPSSPRTACVSGGSPMAGPLKPPHLSCGRQLVPYGTVLLLLLQIACHSDRCRPCILAHRFSMLAVRRCHMARTSPLAHSRQGPSRVPGATYQRISIGAGAQLHAQCS